MNYQERINRLRGQITELRKTAYPAPWGSILDAAEAELEAARSVVKERAKELRSFTNAERAHRSWLRNKAHISGYIREWSRRNPDRKAAHTENRRTAKLRGAGKVTAQQWRAIIEQFDSRCAYCLEKPSKLTMDHIVALSRGGDHCPENVVPACATCNSRKRAKPVFMMV